MQKINELRLLYITDQQLHSVSCYAQQCVDTFMYHALVIVAGSRGSTGDDASNHSWSHISCHILQRDILTSHQGVFCHALSEQKWT